MTKPYYEQDGITIYHGDCREILPELPKVDLVLTDPPYGMEYHSNYYRFKNPHTPIVGDDAYPIDVINICQAKANMALFTFTRWDKLHLLPLPKSFIVWIKNNWSAGDLSHEYGRMWEGIAFYPKEGHKFKCRPPDVIHANRLPHEQLTHPTQKPIRLITTILEQNYGDTILDPFMGSGTTLVAALQLGRKAIGIEIEEKYCEIAVKRLGQGVLPL